MHRFSDLKQIAVGTTLDLVQIDAGHSDAATSDAPPARSSVAQKPKIQEAQNPRSQEAQKPRSPNAQKARRLEAQKPRFLEAKMSGSPGAEGSHKLEDIHKRRLQLVPMRGPSGPWCDQSCRKYKVWKLFKIFGQTDISEDQKLIFRRP